MQVCRFMKVITNELGVAERGTNLVKYWDDYKQWTGRDLQGEPWCAMFVTWCLVKSNKLGCPVSPKAWHYNCPDMVEHFGSKGKYVEGSEGCKSGYIVFFDWDGDGVADHVGFCEYVGDEYLYTIEGNAYNKVKRCRRNRSSVLGYAKLALKW